MENYDEGTTNGRIDLSLGSTYNFVMISLIDVAWKEAVFLVSPFSCTGWVQTLMFDVAWNTTKRLHWAVMFLNDT